MDVLIQLIQSYGYLIVFAGTLFEGETVVALAGFVAHQGHLHLWLIILISIFGAIVGDNVFFHFGRMRGRNILLKHPDWQIKADKVHAMLERHQNLLIFGSRYMYGFRIVTPIILGTSKISAVRFFWVNLLGAMVWAPIFVFGGYLFGGAIEKLLGDIKKFEGIILIAIIFIISLIRVVAWRRRHQKENQCDSVAPGL